MCDRLPGFHTGLIGEDFSLSNQFKSLGGRWLFLQMHRNQHKGTKNVKNEENIKQSKEQDTCLLTDPKEMNIYRLPDKE